MERQGAGHGAEQGAGQGAVGSLFSHRLGVTWMQVLQLLVCGLVLVPVRLVLVSLVAASIYLCSVAGLAGLAEPPAAPLSGWRAVLQRGMWSSAGHFAFWALGFRVELVGRRAERSEAPILVVAPHTSFLDVFTIALCYASPVARIENSRTTFMWAPQMVGHTIFVDRRCQSSRQQAGQEIIDRASSPLPWPQVLASLT